MYQKLLSLIFLTFIGLSFVVPLYFPCNPAQFEINLPPSFLQLCGFYTTIVVYFVNYQERKNTVLMEACICVQAVIFSLMVVANQLSTIPCKCSLYNGLAFRVTFNTHKHGHCHLSPFQWAPGEPRLDVVLCLLDTRYFVPTLNQNIKF